MSLDIETPPLGFYRCQLVKDGPYVGVKIWFGPPNDPVTGEPLDRSPRFQADVNGRHYALELIWPNRLGEEISRQQYLALCAEHQRGAHSEAGGVDVHRRVNPLTVNLPI